MRERINSDIKKFNEIEKQLSDFWDNKEKEEITKINEVWKDNTKDEFVSALSELQSNFDNIRSNIEELNSILNKRAMKEEV